MFVDIITTKNLVKQKRTLRIIRIPTSKIKNKWKASDVNIWCQLEKYSKSGIFIIIIFK